MDLELSDDQLELRAAINAVLIRESPVAVARAVSENGTAPDKLWQTMVELGWPALTIPDHCGGIGLGAVEAAVLCEELGNVVGTTCLLPTVTQFTPMVAACGSEEQQHHWLSLVADGSLRATLAIAEQSASFDPTFTTTQVFRDGERWVVNGTKRYVMEADHCDVLAVTVRREDGAVAVAIVDAHDCDIVPIVGFDASRSYCDVAINGVGVAADRLLIPEAPTAIPDALHFATMGLAMETVGVCNAIFNVTLAYAKQREQFGVPIGSFQAIKHKFADLAVALERARSLGYFAALCIAERDDRRAIAVAAAKAAAGDAQRVFAKEGIQIHAGIGYTWEHDMHLYVRRAKANEQLFGTASMHRATIADLLGV